MSKTRMSDYLKIADAAEFLGVSQNTLRKWADDGKVRSRRNPVNGYRLFKTSDLDSFLKKLEESHRPTSRKPR